MHNCIQKSWLNFFALVLCALGEIAYARSAMYEAIEVKGDFHIWEGVSVGWRPLSAGDILKNDALIQSLGGGLVHIKEVGKFYKGSAQTVRLESERRVIFRLHDALTRKVTLSSNFIKSLAPTLKENKKDADSLDISTLWDKIASLASLANEHKGGDNTKVGGIKPNKSLAAKTDSVRIDITYPAKGGLFIVPNLPLEIPVQWKPTQQNQPESNAPPPTYEVFLKSSSESNYTLIGKTNSTQFSVPFKRFGSYAVRIQTVDGKSRSEEWHLNISDGLSGQDLPEVKNPQK